MNEIQFRPIKANEAKRLTDTTNDVNKDAMDELNHIYGQIHEAINHGRYRIRVYIHYQDVIDQLCAYGYNAKFVKKCEELNFNSFYKRQVAIFDISWGDE